MDAATKARIASEVHEKREQAKLSQKELAAMAGVSTNTVGNMERGTSFPQRSHLLTICGLLGIRLDEGDPMDDDAEDLEQPTVKFGNFSPETRTVLNVVGLYLDSLGPSEREESIARLVRAAMLHRL